MKIAVQYRRNKHQETRTKFVAFNGGYHGDTFATMSVCDPEEGMHKYFASALACKSEDLFAHILYAVIPLVVIPAEAGMTEYASRLFG